MDKLFIFLIDFGPSASYLLTDLETDVFVYPQTQC